MAHLLLCGRRVLEFRGRGRFRILNQSARGALLYARTEYNTCSRPHCVIRCVWPSGTWPDALLSARVKAGDGVEGEAAGDLILEHQYRSLVHGDLKHASDWSDARLGLRAIRNVVRTVARVFAKRNDECASLAACSGRYHFCLWGCRTRLVRFRAMDRTFLRSKRRRGSGRRGGVGWGD